MISSPHRLKGGALLLGAEEPGRPGPFGTWTADLEPTGPDVEDTAPPGSGCLPELGRTVCSRWTA
ncbi:hypothetical protein M2284_003574 [Rhodococcus sp. LBL1]|uniref:Uncharacterized protein n=1 Tax=Prescottella agglutinans TaxID=1644129 RepID=A0ABT6M661_9NOCA|nr:hypothetical protein [Prescottella agglutinans]MDH6279806.1 hypothetical protein [Prescottella agglutinans]MDH6679352.1 hypothetical protein [Rhodococcus sp. LBL1]MDH6685507.1 hypothetical protein [Rhodococcus sp. LBL2]